MFFHFLILKERLTYLHKLKIEVETGSVIVLYCVA